jgi:nucleoside-diphosphate-sugar epimerase
MSPIIEKDCLKILGRVNFSVLKNKRVLVTGANGFLGQYIVSALCVANEKQNLNCKITCISLRGPGAVIKSCLAGKSGKYILFKKIDLAKPFHMPEDFDFIFHAAGYAQPSLFVNDPTGTVGVNVSATQEFLRVAERSKGTFVFFSSVEVYGEMPQGMKAFKEAYGGGAAPVGPRAIYGASKRLGEALCTFAAEQRGVRARVVRISHVYGPGAPANDRRVMSDFIRKALGEKEIDLLDAGTAKKTYGYIADVIAMIFFAGLHGKETIYNVGGQDVMSVKQLADRIGKYTGAKVRVPKEKSRANFVGRDPSVVKLDLSRIKKEMKKISFTPFATGLANTIEWGSDILKV